jgi:hypothetical protein
MPRRAETTQRAVELDRSRTPFVVAAFVFLGLAATAGAIFWGTSDAGQINVSATIANSQQVGNEGETGNAVPTPNEQQRLMPNGGLVAQDGNSTPAPTPEPTPAPTDAASTTEIEGEEATDTTDAPQEEPVPASAD